MLLQTKDCQTTLRFMRKLFFYLRCTIICAQCMKITKNVAFESFNFGVFCQFFSIKIDLSGNTVRPQASGFQNLAKMDHF